MNRASSPRIGLQVILRASPWMYQQFGLASNLPMHHPVHHPVSLRPNQRLAPLYNPVGIPPLNRAHSQQRSLRMTPLCSRLCGPLLSHPCTQRGNHRPNLLDSLLADRLDRPLDNLVVNQVVCRPGNPLFSRHVNRADGLHLCHLLNRLLFPVIIHPPFHRCNPHPNHRHSHLVNLQLIHHGSQRSSHKVFLHLTLRLNQLCFRRCNQQLNQR